jgi:hypothetical protein
VKRWQGLILLALTAAPSSFALEVRKEGFVVPIPALAVKKDIHPADLCEKIPGYETLVKTYQRKKDGVVWRSLEIEGRVYAYQFHEKGGEGQPDTIYAIVDTDGDGVFESRYGRGEKPETPEWAVRHYFSVHPDKKPAAP